MLRELHIKNFSIIDEVNVEFGKGLNVITGETGAGKSIIIDALSLALGERAAGEYIRSGEKEAVIEAFLDNPSRLLTRPTKEFLDDIGIETEDGLILKRIISSQGKNRAYANNSPVNLQTLSDISKDIIDIHGQYEHQSLLFNERQLELIDAYGGLLTERDEAGILYEDLNRVKKQIADLLQKEKERAQRIDILRFQVNEIEAADLKTDEETNLEEELNILRSSSHLAELANQAYESLSTSDSACISNLSGILNALREISSIDQRAAEALKSLEEAMPLLEETGYFLRDYKDSLEFDPGRLEKVQERLELIKNLKRKYGSTVQTVLDYRESSSKELEELQHSEKRLETLNADLLKTKEILTKKVNSLSKKRKAAAKKIETAIVTQLTDLSMPDTKFSVSISNEKGDDTTDGFRADPTGIDRTEFLISPNPGEDLKPLSKIASGGELSRIMLTLKGIMAEGDRIPILVFDEIDAGIGGKTADNVAKKLKALSLQHQVICITHLPQIASYADEHFKIEKKIEKNRTITVINRIEKKEREAEVARMLSGEISDTSIKHAKEMLKKARR